MDDTRTSYTASGEVTSPGPDTTDVFGLDEDRKYPLAEKTGARLDTVDIADDSGWQVDSTHEADVFTKGAVTIEVRYSADDDIENAVKRSASEDFDTIGEHTAAKFDQLRSWLTGRPYMGAPPLQPADGSQADFAAAAGGWAREEFIAAVEDPVGYAFLMRLLELIDINSRLPSDGKHARLYFGKRPGGAVFFFPYGRHFPPFKLAVRAGELLISGCWKGNFAVTGHPGFAALATLLGQDERGPASAVPVAGLDPDELWGVAEDVSRAIN
ncbi:hypothetical protein [Mycobacterium sp. 23]|uniref:hypothetical protein n=1 Tax=Mycobacterium sp. 23 TaxID=3400424 RepID=UPI003AADB7ED